MRERNKKVIIDGIIQVKADYQKGECYVEFEKGKGTIEDIVEAINKAGYKAILPLPIPLPAPAIPKLMSYLEREKFIALHAF